MTGLKDKDGVKEDSRQEGERETLPESPIGEKVGKTVEDIEKRSQD